MIENNFRLDPTIMARTKDAKTILELGAGIFRMFYCYPSTAHKVGVELIQSYIDNRIDKECVAIQGNALEFERLLDEAGYIEPFDALLLIDFVEHLDKEPSLDLIKRTKKWAKKVFVFTPLDEHPQTGASQFGFAFPNIRKDVVAKGEAPQAIEAQRHKSTWYVKDFEDLGFHTIWVNKNYHPGRHKGAIWAEWSRD
jgi:hypothetical protein